LKGREREMRGKEDKILYINFIKKLHSKMRCKILLSLSHSLILHSLISLSLIFCGAQCKALFGEDTKMKMKMILFVWEKNNSV
jgi:hypothetical protein